MPRQTRFEIEQSLLRGVAITWKQNGKSDQIQLKTPTQRRLFKFILGSSVRAVKGLPDNFAKALANAFDGQDDPASVEASGVQIEVVAGPWYLKRLESENFGGINVWKGSVFEYDVDGDSLIIEGPNGSGKSSFVGALTWAFREKRIRDAANDTGGPQLADVFDIAGSKIGTWPPIASYPNRAGLSDTPGVRVKLTFINSKGDEATIERTLLAEKRVSNIDPRLKIPDILIETGLMMPARLAHMRFDSDQTHLVGAVQMLTGLDEIAALGDFAADLAHKGRDYLGHAKGQGRDALMRQFTECLSVASKNLTTIGRPLPEFAPKDTVDDVGVMTRLVKEISTNANSSMQVIASDLSPNLDLALAAVQQQVAHAIELAKTDLENGIDDLQISSLLASIDTAVTEEVAATLSSAKQACRQSLDEAISLRRQAESDSRFQMKAIAGAWHQQHRVGPIDNCPLCDQSLESNAELRKEIEHLRLAGEAAQRTFRDNLNAIRANLDAEIPSDIRHQMKSILMTVPSDAYKAELKAKFVDATRYSDILTGLCKMVDAALQAIPPDEADSPDTFSLPDSPMEAKEVIDAINIAGRILWLRSWKQQYQPAWEAWWQSLVRNHNSTGWDTFGSKLERLDRAIKAGAPYRDAAKALSDALILGGKVHAIDVEQKCREDIAEALAPLKDLRKFAEAETKRAIEELSQKMMDFLDQIYISDKLKFQAAHLEKKAVTVRASIEPELCINAALVANTSWIRALLWAFIFAVREEAIDQLGEDRLPLLVLDDPQATFDMHHSLRWIQRIVAFQKASTAMQVLIATYDESFLDQLDVAGLEGRRCYLSAANADIGHIHVAEGRTVQRAWEKASRENTADAGFSYIEKTRVHIEAMLKVMLRGEHDTRGLTLGKLKERIKILNASCTPWTRHEFKDLYGKLDGAPEIKYLEQSHHTTQRTLSMANAIDVEKFWRTKLEPALGKAFRAIKEYRLLHGESKALHADPPTAPMPEGYRSAVREIPLVVRARASASTGGRVADGNLSLEELSGEAHDSIVLGNHQALRLISTTLEPVARKGDILLTSEHEQVVSGSLVVASYADKLLARRFMTSAEHPDIAVLLAQAISPSDIALPVIAHKSTIRMQKIVGILFDPQFFVTTTSGFESEVTSCGAEEEIRKFSRLKPSLIKVSGASAEPQALNGQYLLAGDHVASSSDYVKLDGRPVLALDSDGHQYFKRLRVIQPNAAVLESLHSGGDFPPIYLPTEASSGTYLSKVFPVVGVLFER